MERCSPHLHSEHGLILKCNRKISTGSEESVIVYPFKKALTKVKAGLRPNRCKFIHADEPFELDLVLDKGDRLHYLFCTGCFACNHQHPRCALGLEVSLGKGANKDFNSVKRTSEESHLVEEAPG